MRHIIGVYKYNYKYIYVYRKSDQDNAIHLLPWKQNETTIFIPKSGQRELSPKNKAEFESNEL